MSKLSALQVEWQSTALHALLQAEDEGLGPWVGAPRVVESIKDACGCRGQAASGALRSLLSVGLADRAENPAGAVYWKPTLGAERAYQLLLDPIHDG